MQSSTILPNDTYHTESNLHERKGKTKTKYDREQIYIKIIKYKEKNHISNSVKISKYDVYKFAHDKKNKTKYNKNIRVKGNDYKLHTINQENGINPNIMTSMEFNLWDFNTDYYLDSHNQWDNYYLYNCDRFYDWDDYNCNDNDDYDRYDEKDDYNRYDRRDDYDRYERRHSRNTKYDKYMW